MTDQKWKEATKIEQKFTDENARYKAHFIYIDCPNGDSITLILTPKKTSIRFDTKDLRTPRRWKKND